MLLDLSIGKHHWGLDALLQVALHCGEDGLASLAELALQVRAVRVQEGELVLLLVNEGVGLSELDQPIVDPSGLPLARRSKDT